MCVEPNASSLVLITRNTTTVAYLANQQRRNAWFYAVKFASRKYFLLLNYSQYSAH